jgi:hypothetical protein
MLIPCAALSEPLNNQSIISLQKAGLGDSLIIDKINSESCGYEVSTENIISLKNAGLSDAVIAAMVRRCSTLDQKRGLAGDDSSPDPAVRHTPGIYIMEDWTSPNKLQILRPSKSSGVRSSGNGSIVFPFIVRMVIPGGSSHVSLQTRMPTFYFYFSTSNENVSDFGLENSVSAQSPDEFSLVKFSKRGEDREVMIGRLSSYEGMTLSVRKGIDPRFTIHFETSDFRPGIYKVTLNRELEDGEYGFVFTGANGASRIYDFSVNGPSPAMSVRSDRK